MREVARATAGLAIILSFLFGNIVFLGKSLVYSDNFNPLAPEPRAENYGKRFVPPSVWFDRGLRPDPNFHDPGAALYQWEPAGEILRRCIKARAWPFWDPYVGGGAPLMANLTAGFFFPPYLAVIALGNSPLLKNLYFLGMLLLSGSTCYVFLRKHGLFRAPSFFGAAGWMLSGGLVMNVGSFIGHTACCLPVALLGTRWFLDSPTRRRASALTLLFASIALASFPPVLLGIFGLVVLYILFDAWACRGTDLAAERARSLALFGLASALAIGVVAFYYVPGVLATRLAPQLSQVYDTAARVHLDPVALGSLISPYVLEPLWLFTVPGAARQITPQLNFVGVVVLLLASLARPLEDKRAKALWWTLLAGGGLTLLKLFGVPPVEWVAFLPGFRAIHFAQYFGIFLCFVFAGLAAFGLQAFEEGYVGTRKLYGGVFAAVAVFGVSLWVGQSLGILHSAAARRWTIRMSIRALVAAVVLTVLILGRFRARFRMATPATVVLAGAFLLEAFSNVSFARQFRWNVWRNPPGYVRYLAGRGGLERVLPFGALPADANSPFGISSVESLMTFNPGRSYEFFRRYFKSADLLFLRGPKVVPPEAVLDAAAVRFVAMHESAKDPMDEVRRRGYALRYQESTYLVFERDTLPRYRFTNDVEFAPPDADLGKMAEAAPRGRIWVEESQFASGPTEGMDRGGIVRVLEFNPNRVVLDVEAPGSGLVYCADAMAPGWRVFRNDSETRFIHANFAFRAVPVETGHSVIRMEYEPPGLRPGLVLTAIALLSTVILVRPYRWPVRSSGPLDKK